MCVHLREREKEPSPLLPCRACAQCFSRTEKIVLLARKFGVTLGLSFRRRLGKRVIETSLAGKELSQRRTAMDRHWPCHPCWQIFPWVWCIRNRLVAGHNMSTEIGRASCRERVST